MSQTVETIIERLGGAEAAAKLLGVGTEALRKWRQTRAIPSRHHAPIIAATGFSLSDMPGAATPSPLSPDQGATMQTNTATPEGATAVLVLDDIALANRAGDDSHDETS